MPKRKSRRPQPLAPPPQSSALRSRKRARQVTTLFHKYTTERDEAVRQAKKAGCCLDDDDDDKVGFNNNNDINSKLSPHQRQLLAEVKKWDDKLSEIGGREEYQRASQMNTALFSTSKWVLGILGKWGWLDGLPLSSSSGTNDSIILSQKNGKKEKVQRRNVRLLEVGAINTQLLDAAERTRMRKTTNNHKPNNDAQGTTRKLEEDVPTKRVYHLDVNAIDIRSTDARIQQLDFFDLPLPCSNDIVATEDIASFSTNTTQQYYYDVIVNSMVINCVTTPAKRGQMLSLCYKHLCPGGVLFLTLPKLCLIQSKYMSRSYFEEVLTNGVGFEILQDVARESPKIAFFVLRKPERGNDTKVQGNKGNNSKIETGDHDKYNRMPVLHRGKKFRNTFAVTLDKEDVGANK